MTISTAVAQSSSPSATPAQLRAFVVEVLAGEPIRKWNAPIVISVIGQPMERHWPAVDRLVGIVRPLVAVPISHEKVPTGARRGQVDPNVLFVLTENIDPYLGAAPLREKFKKAAETEEQYRSRHRAVLESGGWSISMTDVEAEDSDRIVPAQKIFMGRLENAAPTLPAKFAMHFMSALFDTGFSDAAGPSVLNTRRGPYPPSADLTDLDRALIAAIYDRAIPFDVPVEKVADRLVALMLKRLNGKASNGAVR